MNKIIATVAAAAMLIGAQTSAEASSKSAKFALGLAIGVGVVGLLAAKSAHANQGYGGHQVRHYGYSTGGHGRPDGACRVWRIDCRDGSDRACRKYERHC